MYQRDSIQHAEAVGDALGAQHRQMKAAQVALNETVLGNQCAPETLGGLLAEAREAAARLRAMVHELGNRLDPVSYRSAQQNAAGIGPGTAPDAPKALIELRSLIGMLEQTENDASALIAELRI